MLLYEECSWDLGYSIASCKIIYGLTDSEQLSTINWIKSAATWRYRSAGVVLHLFYCFFEALENYVEIMSDNPAPEADANKSSNFSTPGNRSSDGVVVLTPADRMNNNHCNAADSEASDDYGLKIESLKITDNLNAKHTLSYDVSYLNGSSSPSPPSHDKNHPPPQQQPHLDRHQTKPANHSNTNLALSSASIDIRDKNDLVTVKLFAYAICREYLGGIWKSISLEQFELIKLT